MKIFTIDEQNAYMCNLIRAYESTECKDSASEEKRQLTSDMLRNIQRSILEYQDVLERETNMMNDGGD